MVTADLNTTECVTPDEGLHVAFPIHSATGAADTATVWINLDPDGEAPEHRDSSEELLLVIEGEVEATVDGETGRLTRNQLALVPAMAPHSLRNLGEGPARVLGFFSGSTVVSTFTQPLGTGDEQVFVIGAPLPVALPLEEPITLTV